MFVDKELLLPAFALGTVLAVTLQPLANGMREVRQAVGVVLTVQSAEVP